MAVALVASACGAEDVVPCTIRELNDIRCIAAPDSRLFLSTGVVQMVAATNMTVRDATGSMRVQRWQPDNLALGDMVEMVTAKVVRGDHDKQMVVRRFSVLGRGAVHPPEKVRLADLDERRHDFTLVTVEGTVVEVTHDELDPNYTVLLIKDDEAMLPVFTKGFSCTDGMLDCRLRVTGMYYRLVSGKRRFSGPFVDCGAGGIEVLVPSQRDRFAAPPVDPGDFLTPRDLAKMGLRTVDGRVLATWQGCNAMLKVDNLVVNVSFVEGCGLPPCGALVKVAGYPVTDLYRLNIAKGEWKEIPAPPEDEEPAEPINIDTILSDELGRQKIRSAYHGQLVRVTGTVCEIYAGEQSKQRFYMSSGKFRIPIDFSSAPTAADGLESGCVVEATGRCLMETDSWTPYDIFPQIRGFAIVCRHAGDVHVLSRPPWWSPERLFGVVAALVAALAGVFVWNRALTRMVERRSRALYRTEIAKVGSDLRIGERTRLAVELHDTLSQNLTGIALEINAGHLEMAQKALKNCREELKNCLWDLRSNALEAASMDEAMRSTLAPHMGPVDLSVHFDVPRARLTDQTAHALLRIVRELALNAVRHGGASKISVEGHTDGCRIVFSVSDDGCGFDAARVPGVSEGHFGLDGIRERIAPMDGTMSIDSGPGRGTRITISIAIPVRK